MTNFDFTMFMYIDIKKKPINNPNQKLRAAGH